MEGPPDSTLGFSEDEIERTVDAVFGTSSGSPSPPRFAMEDIHAVDDHTIDFLKTSSYWKYLLPHIERVIETERTASTDTAGFVARVHKQRRDVFAIRCGNPGSK